MNNSERQILEVMQRIYEVTQVASTTKDVHISTEQLGDVSNSDTIIKRLEDDKILSVFSWPSSSAYADNPQLTVSNNYYVVSLLPSFNTRLSYLIALERNALEYLNQNTLFTITWVMYEISQELNVQLNDNTVRIMAFSTNDYYWAGNASGSVRIDDPDIRVKKRKVLSLLHERGIITDIQELLREDSEWIIGYELAVERLKFMQFYEELTKYAEPQLEAWLLTHRQEGVGSDISFEKWGAQGTFSRPGTTQTTQQLEYDAEDGTARLGVKLAPHAFDPDSYEGFLLQAVINADGDGLDYTLLESKYYDKHTKDEKHISKRTLTNARLRINENLKTTLGISDVVLYKNGYFRLNAGYCSAQSPYKNGN